MNEQTIYIVTEGNYSDYHIVAVFDNEEIAKEFVSLQNDSDDYEIEPYILNCFAPQINERLRFFCVEMDKEGNSKIRLDEYGDPSFRLTYYFDWKKRGGPPTHVVVTAYVYAKDEQHAAKIANEKRAQFIASGEWDQKEVERQEYFTEHAKFYK